MTVRFTKVTSATALAACLAFAACSKSDNTATADSATAMGKVAVRDTAAPAMVDPAAEAKTNADIFAVVHTANQGEIDAGKLASTKATNPAVKAFAKQMVTDHSQMHADATALAAKLAITPMMKDSGMVKDAMKDQKSMMDKKAGKGFDEDYLEKQVSDHQKVLDFITKSINDTHNAEIKAALQGAQSKVQMHLDAAKALKDKIKA